MTDRLPPAEKARREATEDMGAIHSFVGEKKRVPYGDARARCRDGRKPQTINGYFRQLLDKKRIVVTYNTRTSEVEVWFPPYWDEWCKQQENHAMLNNLQWIRDGFQLGPALLAMERQEVKRWEKVINFDVDWS